MAATCTAYKLDMGGAIFGAKIILLICNNKTAEDFLLVISQLSLFLLLLDFLFVCFIKSCIIAVWLLFIYSFLAGACANCGEPKFKHSKAAIGGGGKKVRHLIRPFIYIYILCVYVL